MDRYDQLSGGFTPCDALLPPEGQGIDEFVAGLSPSAWQTWLERFDAMAEADDLERKGMQINLPGAITEIVGRDRIPGPNSSLVR